MNPKVNKGHVRAMSYDPIRCAAWVGRQARTSNGPGQKYAENVCKKKKTTNKTVVIEYIYLSF